MLYKTSYVAKISKLRRRGIRIPGTIVHRESAKQRLSNGELCAQDVLEVERMRGEDRGDDGNIDKGMAI
uniref:60S ribosomal protein L19 n=1 Tax=Loa loa TaxID=7209 RepID=A0A1I7V852_LOALO